MKSIFKKRNADVEALFESAESPAKVMCIPFDYAKRTHTAMVCDGSGRQLRGAFNVENNRKGLEFLLGVVSGLCKKHSIRNEHVFFGGEDCGSYAFNFVHALVSLDYLVVGINTKLAKDERENSRASTDLIDTVGVAGMMIKMRGRTIGIAKEETHIIKRLYRQRSSLVKSQTASINRIHRLVNELCPGFLNYELSGISPFCRASLWLMNDRFSAPEIEARKTPALTRNLGALMIRDPEDAALKVKQLAHNALPPPAAMVGALKRSLAEELSIYTLLSDQTIKLECDMAKMLAATPGAMLTTMSGIGLRWAFGLYAELGDPSRRRNVNSMASLAGLVPRVKQTGGPEKAAVVGRRNKMCNAFLKNIVMSSTMSLAEYGHPEWRDAFRADKALGRDAKGRLAQKLLRIALYTMDHQTFVLPPSLHKHGTREQLAEYYVEMWPKVLIKWRNIGAIKEATAEGTPLRKWRDMAQELYGIKLDLKSPQTGRK